MPAYGTNKYPSNALRAVQFIPGQRAVMFGTLTAQVANWAKAQGAPVWPARGELVTVGVEVQFSDAPGA